MTQPVIEPNFEGEEMKIPEGITEGETVTESPKSVLSTAMIVILTIALIAIFAGLGYWYTLVMNVPLNDNTNESPMVPETNNGEMTNEEMSDDQLSNSDEIEAIEADIDSTELEEMDRELDQIDAELEAELGAQ